MVYIGKIDGMAIADTDMLVFERAGIQPEHRMQESEFRRRGNSLTINDEGDYVVGIPPAERVLKSARGISGDGEA